MTLPKPCDRCGITFPRTGRQCRFCETCIRKAYIIRLFTKNGKFRDCNNLKEAIIKYGV